MKQAVGLNPKPPTFEPIGQHARESALNYGCPQSRARSAPPPDDRLFRSRIGADRPRARVFSVGGLSLCLADQVAQDLGHLQELG